MSALSSWIDPDEISELMPLLLPKSREEKPVELPEDTADSGEAPVVPGMVGVEMVETASDFSVEDVSSTTVETAIGGNGETVPERDVAGENLPGKTEREVDFSLPEAYDAKAFPEAADLKGDTGERDRQSAAAQAAVTLERARDRANEGGLLKNAGEPASDPAPGLRESVVEPVPESSDSPPATETGAASPEMEEPEAAEPEPEAAPALAPTPVTFRDRLAHFADTAIQLTGGSDPVVTDFESYPLYPAASESGAGNPRSIDSIVRMNRLISRLPDEPNGDAEKTAQISLEDNRWFCVLTQGSAAGGVCASLQIPGPISNETAEQLHRQLHTTLTGPPA